MPKIPQILTGSAKTIIEVSSTSLMFLVSQVTSFFPYLIHSPGTNKYVSVVQCSAVMLSANKQNKTKREKKDPTKQKRKELKAIIGSKLTHKQLLLKVSCATNEGNSLLPHTSLTHLFCCPCLFQLKEKKQPACTSVLFCKTLSQ